MKNIFKSITLFLICLLTMSSITLAEPLNITFEKIQVNGMEITQDTTINVQKNEQVDIDVTFKSLNTTKDVSVRAHIRGYEYGTIEDVTEEFDVESNTVYSESLTLYIPQDIDSGKYKLHIEVSDTETEFKPQQIITLNILGKKHKLNIQDVILPTEIEPGKILTTHVRVENIGNSKEEDIKLVLSIPELNLITADYIDELVTEDTDDEESSQSKLLHLKIPKNTQPGTYKVEVQVQYNRGKNIEQLTKFVNVIEAVPPVVKPVIEKTLVTVDTNTQTMSQGEGAAYRVTLANLAEQRQTYSLELLNTQTWATYRVDPAIKTLEPGSTGEIVIYILANEDALPGKHTFTVNVKSKGKVIKTFDLEANVQERLEDTLVSVRKILAIGFITLVVLLVILILVVLFKKRKETREEVPSKEGKEDYY